MTSIEAFSSLSDCSNMDIEIQVSACPHCDDDIHTYVHTYIDVILGKKNGGKEQEERAMRTWTL